MTPAFGFPHQRRLPGGAAPAAPSRLARALLALSLLLPAAAYPYTLDQLLRLPLERLLELRVVAAQPANAGGGARGASRVPPTVLRADGPGATARSAHAS
jgi:hypothetical protein